MNCGYGWTPDRSGNMPMYKSLPQIFHRVYFFCSQSTLTDVATHGRYNLHGQNNRNDSHQPFRAPQEPKYLCISFWTQRTFAPRHIFSIRRESSLEASCNCTSSDFLNAISYMTLTLLRYILSFHCSTVSWEKSIYPTYPQVMLHHQTPLFLHHRLSTERNQNIYLKMDCHQPTGSFKIRGIGHLCSQKARNGTKGFVSSSGGNAGLAVAYCGKQLGLPTTIVTPSTTPEHVRERMRILNARVLEHGSVWDESDVFARKYALRHHCSYIHPFDDPAIWTGHSTLVDELKGQGPKPDLIICSVGGGGLLCGILEGLWNNDWNDVPVMAVETYGAASLHASVQAGRRISIDAITSIAKTLGARTVAAHAFEWTKKHPIACVQVTDASTVQACVEILDEYRVLVEPACSASFSALFLGHPLVEQAQNIVIVLCGGSGVTSDMLKEWQRTYA